MAFVLPDLPYARDALAPYLSAETLEYHHGKHHNAYVANLNGLLEGADAELSTQEDLEGIILSAEGGVFNNAAQVWNHSFYWKCMKPGGGGRPGGELAKAIEASFGSYDDLAKELTQAAVTQFGSGWAWLVKDGDALKVTKTGNADLPLKHGQTALLTVDVWEHAYYIDYRNLRPKYVEAFLNNLVDWDFVAANLAAAE
ncbi:MAG: superoxide dismutase [Actinobacteria bacterium]|jgi:Fe-Mn family superoxide dismutase|nr:superoxide dismutase [Actinomycetota bacterium]